jgi:hypothetical protein
MHMNSAPQYLPSEDRLDYERLLDEALRTAPNRPNLAAARRQLNSEQLRTMALDATALITAEAAAEYEHYVKLREELRRPAPSTVPGGGVSGSAGTDTGTGFDTSMTEDRETPGAGIIPVIAALTPFLAGTAAAIFLLVGYFLKVLDPKASFARTMLTTGWVFGALTAVAILCAAVGLLLTALRDSSGAEHADTESSEEVARAREAWHDALLHRGMVPFFEKALTTARGPQEPSQQASGTPGGRIPRLGYDRPRFSSRDSGTTPGSRPRFGSPDYTSPDFGGPEHQPE